jgi:type II secretory pathway component PulJ
MKKSLRGIRGISLIETLVYVTILILVSLLVVSALSSLGRSYRLMHQAEAIERTALVALERMGREIRGASSIDTAQSTFDSSNGSLALNTEDENGNSVTLRFYLSSGRVRIEENAVDQGPLSPLDVSVTSLVFRRISTPESEAVKIEMEVTSSEEGDTKVRKFYSTVTLRGSYLP